MAWPAFVVQGGDTTLLKSTTAGDTQAFESLYRRYRSRVLAFAAKRLGDYYEAEDVTQDVFLEAYRCAANYQGRSSLLSWLLGIAHNRIRRSFRRRNPLLLPLEIREVQAVAAPGPSVDRQVEANLMLERADRVASRDFNPTQRKAFHLRYGENQSMQAIACQLGMSHQAVKTSLFRSRRVLAQRAGRFEVASGSQISRRRSGCDDAGEP